MPRDLEVRIGIKLTAEEVVALRVLAKRLLSPALVEGVGDREVIRALFDHEADKLKLRAYEEQSVVVDQMTDRYKEIVDRIGWAALGVFADGETPGFLYTIGVEATFGHPDLVISGLPNDTAHAVIADIVEDIAQDRLTLSSGDVLPLGGDGNYELRVAEASFDKLVQAQNFYGKYAPEVTEPRALQALNESVPLPEQLKP